VAVDTTTRCPVTELVAAFCACRGCRNLPDVAPLDLDEESDDRPSARMGQPFDAHWPGKCSGCKEKFSPGELIRADGYGGYVIVDCCGGGTGA